VLKAMLVNRAIKGFKVLKGAKVLKAMLVNRAIKGFQVLKGAKVLKELPDSKEVVENRERKEERGLRAELVFKEM
jgi:hypothetical protein